MASLAAIELSILSVIFFKLLPPRALEFLAKSAVEA
jgi:hypothetical protein